jgi:hypothetical protein
MSEPMSEDLLNRIQSMLDKAVETVRADGEQRLAEVVETVRQDLRSEIRASEQRLAEGGRLQFQQLAGLYRSTVEKVEHLEKHLGERIDATRGSIESLRSSLERQDFRADELARRMTALETRPER